MRLLAIAALSLIASPAAAYDICDEAWFIRNLHFDRAGFCFGTALGQATFDNSDCVGREISLQPEAMETVNKIKEFEGWFGCKVDTGRTTLDLPFQAQLRALENLPIPTDTGSGCLGWLGRDIPLRAGHRPDAPVVGTIRMGDNIIWEYDFVAPDGWYLVSFSRDDTQVGIGWTNETISDLECTSFAG